MYLQIVRGRDTANINSICGRIDLMSLRKCIGKVGEKGSGGLLKVSPGNKGGGSVLCSHLHQLFDKTQAEVGPKARRRAERDAEVRQEVSPLWIQAVMWILQRTSAGGGGVCMCVSASISMWSMCL